MSETSSRSEENYKNVPVTGKSGLMGNTGELSMVLTSLEGQSRYNCLYGGNISGAKGLLLQYSKTLMRTCVWEADPRQDWYV